MKLRGPISHFCWNNNLEVGWKCGTQKFIFFRSQAFAMISGSFFHLLTEKNIARYIDTNLMATGQLQDQEGAVKWVPALRP